MSGTGTTTTPAPALMPMPVAKPTLGEVTNGLYPCTGGMSNAAFMATTRMVRRSTHCYHLQQPTEAHKQLKMKMTISFYSDTDTSNQFYHDKKQMTAEELSEMIIDHMEFHGIDMEFCLPDPKDASKVCNILCED